MNPQGLRTIIFCFPSAQTQISTPKGLPYSSHQQRQSSNAISSIATPSDNRQVDLFRRKKHFDPKYGLAQRANPHAVGASAVAYSLVLYCCFRIKIALCSYNSFKVGINECKDSPIICFDRY
jgi:hypothetical protein